MSKKVDQRNTILNLYNSGIDPETISLELDIKQEVIMNVIKNESMKELKKTTNNAENVLLNRLYLDAVIDINKIIKESQVSIWKALKSKPDYDTSFKDTQNILEKYGESKVNLVMLHIDLVGSTGMSLSMPIDRLTTIIRIVCSANVSYSINVWWLCPKIYWGCSFSIFCSRRSSRF